MWGERKDRKKKGGGKKIERWLCWMCWGGKGAGGGGGVNVNVIAV